MQLKTMATYKTMFSMISSPFLEVVVQQPIFSSLLLSCIPGGGSWELVDAFSLCCLTWHFWKILAA